MKHRKASVDESCDVEFFRCMITRLAHASGVAMSAATECGYELSSYPPYLLDLAPSDLCLFQLLKEHLRGTQFSSDNDATASVEDF